MKESVGCRVGLVRRILIFFGISMMALALAADYFGIGGYPGLGLSQLVLAIVGFGTLLAGFAFGINVVRHWTKRLMFSRGGLLLGGLITGLLIAEFGLCALELLELIEQPWMGIDRRQRTPDSTLGLRGLPHAPGHDAWGFRNDSVPDQAVVVALGDSQTWGHNARRSEAWPQMLARLSAVYVYNMALPSYGPVQYWALTEEAFKLSPKVIVIGLYFGNDLWDAYALVYRNDAYRHFRINESSNSLLNDTVATRSQALWDRWEIFRNQLLGATPGRWSIWLARHSAIVRLVYQRGWGPAGTKPEEEYEEEYQVAKAWALAFPDQGAVYENGTVRTVFATAYRLLALDFDEPRITEGLRITKEMILRIQARTDVAGVKLLVLLIPTKEMVYANAVETWQGYLDETYSRLVQMELRGKAAVLSMCKENGIECLDALPALEQAVEGGEQIYPTTPNSHPNARGYFLLAAAVHEALIKGGWLKEIRRPWRKASDPLGEGKRDLRKKRMS